MQHLMILHPSVLPAVAQAVVTRQHHHRRHHHHRTLLTTLQILVLTTLHLLTNLRFLDTEEGEEGEIEVVAILEGRRIVPKGVGLIHNQALIHHLWIKMRNVERKRGERKVILEGTNGGHLTHRLIHPKNLIRVVHNIFHYHLVP